MKIHWAAFVAAVTSVTFWIELYLHWVAICSNLDRFVLVPMEEWASDPDNCSVESFKRIHRYATFIRLWGSLNKRADLRKAFANGQPLPPPPEVGKTAGKGE